MELEGILPPKSSKIIGGVILKDLILYPNPATFKRPNIKVSKFFILDIGICVVENLESKKTIQIFIGKSIIFTMQYRT